MIYIGIDPGGSGGIAALDETGALVVMTRMPETARDILDALDEFKGDRAIAMIETVGVMPAQGIVSAFTFGRNVGGLHMALTAARIPYDQVVPRKWQAAMQCLSGGDKNITKRRAQQLFPSLKVTHAIADALLIAEYCRRIHRGIIGGEVTNGKEESSRAQQTSEARDYEELKGSIDRAIAEERNRRKTLRGGSRGGGKRAAQAGRSIGPAPRDGAGPKRPAR